MTTIAILLARLLLAVLVPIGVAFLGQLLVRLLPWRETPTEQGERMRLERTYIEEIERIASWESALSMACGLSLPFAIYAISVRIIRLASGGQGEVLFPAEIYMAIPHMIAGSLCAAPLVMRLIDSWYHFPQSDELKRLYRTSERKHGAIGRLVMDHAPALALFLVVTPIALLGNLYTVVDSEGVDYPANVLGYGRSRIPHADVRRLVEVTWVDESGRQKGRSAFAIYRNGLVLSSERDSRDGSALADVLPRGSVAALQLISGATGRPIERLTLRKGERPDLTVSP